MGGLQNGRGSGKGGADNVFSHTEGGGGTKRFEVVFTQKLEVLAY